MAKRTNRRKRRERKQTDGWLNRYDFAYAGRDTVNSAVKDLHYRAPIILKKVPGEADKVLQWRISQIIKEGGAEIERVGPKILRGAIEDLYKMPFHLLGNFGRRKLAQLKRKLKDKAARLKK